MKTIVKVIVGCLLWVPFSVYMINHFHASAMECIAVMVMALIPVVINLNLGEK